MKSSYTKSRQTKPYECSCCYNDFKEANRVDCELCGNDICSDCLFLHPISNDFLCRKCYKKGDGALRRYVV